MMKHAAIIGFGDILNGDEGIGCFLLEALAQEVLSDAVQLTYLGDDPRLAGGLIYDADMAVIVGALRIGGTPGRLHIWSYGAFQQHVVWMANEFQIIRFLAQALARAELAGGLPRELLFIWIEPEMTNDFGISKRIRKSIWKARQIIKKRLFECGFLPKETQAVSPIVRFETCGTPARRQNEDQVCSKSFINP